MLKTSKIYYVYHCLNKNRNTKQHLWNLGSGSVYMFFCSFLFGFLYFSVLNPKTQLIIELLTSKKIIANTKRTGVPSKTGVPLFSHLKDWQVACADSGPPSMKRLRNKKQKPKTNWTQISRIVLFFGFCFFCFLVKHCLK